MAFDIRFNEEKNQLLKATRGICFDDVVEAIQDGKLLDDLDHPNPKFLHQHIYIVQISGYVYVSPYVINLAKKEIFLKTVYPSRIYTRKYLKGEGNDKAKSK